MNDRPRFALRFISGKYQGGEFPLRMNREIIIGRSSDLDMVLVEDMVSRRHAKISSSDAEVYIQDMGSTNGTFVNGEKIAGKALLHEGDRILVGTSIIKLITVENNEEVSDADARQRLEAAASRKRTTGVGRPMTGSIEEIPLPDLLQLLSTSRKSGTLTVHLHGLIGRIYLRKGQIYFATLNDSFDVKPRKALFRILTWTSGAFELEPPEDRTMLDELKEPTEALLMEGMRQLDEIHRLEKEMPPRSTAIAVARPLETPLRELSPVELDVLQHAWNAGGHIQDVLDASTITDFDTLLAVKKLLTKKILAAAS